MSEKGDPEPIHPKEIYSTLVELVIHGQDNKLNLFSGFLFFQSVLLLAWATVWQMDQQHSRCPILALLSLFGFLSSVAWGILEFDYDDASKGFSKVADQIEQHLPPQYRALTARGKIVVDKPWWGKGGFLIGFVTWGFAFLYPSLELILWKSR